MFRAAVTMDTIQPGLTSTGLTFLARFGVISTVSNCLLIGSVRISPLL